MLKQNENLPSDNALHRWSLWPQHVLLGAIVLLALIVRLWAIGWGLPYSDNYHDEQTVARVVLGMLVRRDWNPRYFQYPSLYFYALRVVFDAHWRYGNATGLYNAVTHFPRKWEPYVTIPGFYVWGRALTATLGAATVALLALIGQRWWNVRVGLTAALVLAVLPFHIRLSQTLRVDVAATLITLLALGAALRLLQSADLGSYALAGLAVGLATATKYNAGAVFLAVIGAHIVRWERASLRQSWRLAWAGLWICIGFVALTPYAVLTPTSFIQGVYQQFTDYRGAGHGDIVGRWPIAAYLQFFATTGLGLLPALAVVLGISVIVVRRDRAGLVLLAFVVPYLLFFLPWPRHFWRNLLPLFPPLVLFAGIGIDAIAAGLSTRLEHIRSRNQVSLNAVRGHFPLLTLTALVIMMPLIGAIQLDHMHSLTDTRVQVSAYIASSLPPNEMVAAELDPRQLNGNPQIISVRILTDHDVRWYRARGIRYLVASSAYRTRSTQPAYKRLRAQATLVHIFDNRPSNVVLRRAGVFTSVLASTQSGVWVEILDLGTHSARSSTTQLRFAHSDSPAS